MDSVARCLVPWSATLCKSISSVSAAEPVERFACGVCQPGEAPRTARSRGMVSAIRLHDAPGLGVALHLKS